MQSEHERRLFRWLILSLFLSASLPLGAMTLGEALDAAWARHPEARLPGAWSGLAEASRLRADSWLGGDVAVELSVIDDRPAGDTGAQELVGGVTLPVALPSHRAARRRVAEGTERVAPAERERLRWALAGEVIEAAWAVRLAQAEHAQAALALEAARGLAADVNRRVRAGELSRADALLADQDRIEAETRLSEAEGRLARARAAWRHLTGLEAIPDDLDRFAREHAEAPPPARHPRLAALAAHREMAGARAGLARAERQGAPVLSLFLRRDRGDRLQPYNDALGVAVSVPLGLASPAAVGIREAELERTRAEVELARAQRDLALRQAQAERARQRARQLLELAERRARLARTRLRLAQRAFELGEMDLYQLLLARREAQAAERQLERRRLERARADSRSLHLAGVIPR